MKLHCIIFSSYLTINVVKTAAEWSSCSYLDTSYKNAEHKPENNCK